MELKYEYTMLFNVHMCKEEHAMLPVSHIIRSQSQRKIEDRMMTSAPTTTYPHPRQK